MTTHYKNRETQGTKLDLNMLRFQEQAMMPKNGFIPKKEVQVSIYAKPYVAIPTDARTVSQQKKKDKIQLTANKNLTKSAETRWANRFKQVSKLKQFDVYAVAKELKVSKDVASHCLTKWSKEGKIVGERLGPSIPIIWRIKDGCHDK